MEGSPAEEAGLHSGDIVLEYDGEEIRFSSDLPPLVGRTQAGETARLTILRGGREMDVDVKIGQLPDEGAEVAQGPSGDSGSASAPLGMSVEDLPAEAADSLGIPGGVLVTGIARGPAFDAGIRPRDVITEINRQQVRSVADFRQVVASLPEGRAVSVRVIRQGRALYLVLKP